MQPSVLLGAGLTVLGLLVLIFVGHAISARRLPEISQPKGLTARFKRFVVVGTDSDLKLELAYLLFLLLVAISAPVLPRPSSDAWLLFLLAFLLGLHLRHWLSRWRLRNLVFFPIILEKRIIYFKGAGDLAVVVLNVSLGAYLASAAMSLAAAQFLGFLVHEVILESRKARRLLARKLYLFDLDGLLISRSTYSQLLRAVSRRQFRKLDRLVDQTRARKEHLLLSAFVALLHDDFEQFERLLDTNLRLIREDPDLTSYFGKALYILGDVENARGLLQLGSEKYKSEHCTAYYALSLLAEPGGRDEVSTVLSIFDGQEKSSLEGKGGMFLDAFHALALAISTSKQKKRSGKELEEALSLVHKASSVNDRILRHGDLGPLGRDYYRANDQIFLDIYGYILFRMENLSFSFRALRSAIADDDTYPWPYFHIALLYERIDRKDLAHSLMIRIANHERSDTILKRLCLTRLGRDGVLRKAGSQKGE